MKIFNLCQANLMILKGATPIGCGTAKRFKVFIEFKENEIFNDLLKKWLNREI